MEEIYLDETILKQFLSGQIGIIADIEQSEIIEDYCKFKGFNNVYHYHVNPDITDRRLIYKSKEKGSINMIHYKRSYPFSISDYCESVITFNTMVQPDISSHNTVIIRRAKEFTISEDMIKNGLKSIINEYLKTTQSEPDHYNNALVISFAINMYTNILARFGVDINKLSKEINEIKIIR